MNLQVQNDATVAAEPAPPLQAVVDAATAAAPEKRKANLRPLASLLPYLDRYRGRALAALGALVLAALTTLVVPIAVRRMID
ncbi:MAG TPA: ABC transporter, partial [Xanthobacteraceae bacterium]